MEFLAGILRDVSPAVGLLIVMLYLGRGGLQWLSKQQEQQVIRDKQSAEFNDKLLSLVGRFDATTKDMSVNHSRDLKLIVDANTSNFQELKQAIERQTQIISVKLEPVRSIEHSVKNAEEKLTQDN
jgi:uncharacterized protein HemX